MVKSEKMPGKRGVSFPLGDAEGEARRRGEGYRYTGMQSELPQAAVEPEKHRREKSKTGNFHAAPEDTAGGRAPSVPARWKWLHTPRKNGVRNISVSAESQGMAQPGARHIRLHIPVTEIE